ncbi:MAG: hypothetical protein ABI954_11095, partial [Pyrinomonadaceae bacterium]
MLKRSSISLNNDIIKTDKKFVRNSESGNATGKFLLVVAILFFVGYGGFNYVVTWYQCSHFKEKMQEVITQAYGLPNNKSLNDPEVIRKKIREIGNYDNVPDDAVITVTKKPTGMEAQVAFTREVNILPFNMYKYKYPFDYTAR